MKKIIIIIIWAFVLLPSCTYYRALRYYQADIDDHKIFPYTQVHKSETPFHFIQGDTNIIAGHKVKAMKRYPADTVDLTLDDFLDRTSSTVAFVVIRNDSILFEKYYDGYTRSSVSTIFSVTKSVTSLLVGIAVEQGYIKSVRDPVTKYIPELLDKDPAFQRLTIEHLLDMRSGIKFKEQYSGLFSQTTRLYYGTNLLRQIEGLRFAHEPGAEHDYQSMTTAVLGLVLERATGQNMADYLEHNVWQPMGMENDATWSMDDRRHRNTKSFGGLNTTAIDLAKIGQLYMNHGNWNGKQIVDSMWVARSTTPKVENEGYQYQWYSMSSNVSSKGNRLFPDSLAVASGISRLSENMRQYYRVYPDRQDPTKWRGEIFYSDKFFALGIMQQMIYVDRSKNVVVVRLGKGSDLNWGYQSFIWRLCNSL